MKISRSTKSMMASATIVLITIVLFQNCGYFGESGHGVSTPQRLSFVGHEVLTVADISRSWESNCLPNPDDATQSIQAVTTFDATDMTITAAVFSNTDCTATPDVVIDVFAPYTLGGLSSVQAGTTDIVLGTALISIVPKSQPIADALNTASFCGVTTWQDNVPTPVPVNHACLGRYSTISDGAGIMGLGGIDLYFGGAAFSSLPTIDPSTVSHPL